MSSLRRTGQVNKGSGFPGLLSYGDLVLSCRWTIFSLQTVGAVTAVNIVAMLMRGTFYWWVDSLDGVVCRH